MNDKMNMKSDSIKEPSKQLPGWTEGNQTADSIHHPKNTIKRRLRFLQAAVDLSINWGKSYMEKI
jgi:hypothetical protein